MRTSLTLNQKQILERLAAAGHTQAHIAKALGIHQSAVSNMYKGERALKLTEAEHLLSMLPETAPVREIPVIGMAGAGNWIEAIENATETIEVPSNIETGHFAVKVSGDSMNRVLPDGSFAIIDPDQKDLFVGKLYVLLNAEGEATIKRYRSEPARFEPVSDNPDHLAFPISALDFKVIGRVTGGVQTF